MYSFSSSSSQSSTSPISPKPPISPFSRTNFSSSSLSSLESEVDGICPSQWRTWTGGVVLRVPTPLLDDGMETHREELSQNVLEALEAGYQIILFADPAARHLSLSDMVDSIRLVRTTMGAKGYGAHPLMVHAGSSSSLSTISLLKQAHDAGASHALLSVPSLPVTDIRQNRFITINYIRRIMDASPLPIMFEAPPSLATGAMSTDDLFKLLDHPICFGLHIPTISSDLIKRISHKTTSKEWLAQKSDIDEYTADAKFPILHSRPQTLLSSLMIGYSGCFVDTISRVDLNKLHRLSIMGIKGDMGALLEANFLQTEYCSSL